MKDFFSEYGRLIIVGALVILLLMFSTPFGQAVTQSISYFTTGFAGKNNASMELVTIGLEGSGGGSGGGAEGGTITVDGTNITLSTDVNGNGKVDKGDTLTFATSYLYSGSNTGPTKFLVLNTNGSDVELLATENYKTSKFNTSSVTTTDDAGKTVQKYEGSTLDTLLNTTYYNSLSSTVQSKIKSKSITQNTWQFTGTPADATVTGLNNSTYTYKKTGVVGSYDRRVYALDIQDVIDYLGTSFTGADLNNMFFRTSTSVSKSAWLRSASYGNNDTAFYVGGYSGYLSYIRYSNYGVARPAFTISLN